MGWGARSWGLRSAHALLGAPAAAGFSSSRESLCCCPVPTQLPNLGPPVRTPATATTVGLPDTGDPHPAPPTLDTQIGCPHPSHTTTDI